MEKYNYNVCFIISHRYYRNYESYIQYYVDNIQKFYPNSLCIIVDNNSTHIEDIIFKFKDYNNIVILSNITSCKFELGAYRFGIHYLIEKNLLNKYDYIVFSQDNFVIKNKYDFNYMKDNNILGMAFGGGNEGEFIEPNYYYLNEHYREIIKRLNFFNIIHKFSICWCCSFILHNSKIFEFLHITRDINITTRKDSISSERYFDPILYYFNKNKRYYMNNVGSISYCYYNVNIINDNVKEYFVKKIQGKTEKTI
jgi:hypothetical protein